MTLDGRAAAAPAAASSPVILPDPVRWRIFLYLAAFHAAQALILARSGRIVKTHRGVHRLFSQLAKNQPPLREFARFLSQAYNLKDIADYELRPGANVPLERASAAIDTAERFIEHIARMLS
jgi:uncharacterized protein (UPF0332 family)